MNKKATRYISENLLLMKEWNWEKNIKSSYNPNMLTEGSNKKVWWKCEKGHEWQSTIEKRIKGTNCPYCSNRKVLEGYNDLQTKYPELLIDWDYSKNKKLPNAYTYGSAESVNWKCNLCGYEWCTGIRKRTKNNTGCPKCSRKEQGIKWHQHTLMKNGPIKNELLLKEWDYSKNDRLPTEYTERSQESVFWVCSKCGYSYKSRISNRFYLNRGCPLCCNKVVVKGKNDFLTTHPNIALEWDYEKNTIKPDEITYGHGKKVWWKCQYGHSYMATVNKRTSKNGTNCPICFKGRQTSFAEQAIYFYVKKIFPDAINSYKEIFNNGMELDIFIPSLKIGIEYDGEAFHKESHFNRELKKYEICKKNNIKLIRMKEKKYEKDHLTANIVFNMEKMYKKENLYVAIKWLISEISPEHHFLSRKKFIPWYDSIDVNFDNEEFEIRKYMRGTLNKSLLSEFPNIASEWCYKKNGELTPDKFKSKSGVKVYWECPTCGNIYKSSIGQRTSGTGCPKCGITKSSKKRSKKIKMIDINTNEIVKIFDSISEASRQMSISSGNIVSVLKGKRKHTKGFYWEYIE